MADALATPTPEEDVKKKSTKMKLLAPLFSVILIVILILVKRQNPDFPIGYVILIGVVIFFIGGIAFFGLEISNKFRQLSDKEKKKSILLNWLF